MPDKDKPKGKQQPDDKAPPDIAEVPFDEIIDAILGAEPEAINEHKEKRRQRKKL